VFRKLAVVIPAFNEEQAIARTLETVRCAVPEAEIIVVDDGSVDQTGALARGVPGVTVVSRQRNRGYGAALKLGIRRSTRPYIAWYDADGQHRPEDLIAVARAAIEGQSDMVIGVRGSGSARKTDRAVGKIVLYLVARIVTGMEIPDLNSGLRCFRREVLLRYLHLLPDGFSASSTSTIMMHKMGFRVGYVPIVANARIGKSTVRFFADGARTLQLIVRIVVLFEAFRVFTGLGLGLLLPGFVYGMAIALTRGQGFPTLAGTAIIAGLLTLFMGILADQVVELRKERFEGLEAPPAGRTAPPDC